MTIAQNTVAKLSVAFVAAAMVFSLVAPAKAATVEELQAQIAALMAQINGLQTTTGTTPASTAAYTFTRALTIGSQGADVTALQTYLIGAGHAIPAGATGYFGAQTASAVAAWQTANMITPAAGYFGPVSQAKYNALMAAVVVDEDEDDTDTDEDDTTSGELGDGEGSITVSSASGDESSLNEGEEGGVLGFDVEVDGDVEINRVDVFAEVTDSTTASDNADDYFVRAILMVDGEEVAELDAADFDTDSYSVVANGATDDEEYRLRFTDLGLVFADGDEPEFQVGFEVVGSLDTADLAGDWDVELDSVRFVDGEGFSDSEDNLAQTDSFGFDAEETAELTVSEANDNPVATVIEVDADDQTENVEVFMFEIEEENGVDVVVEDIKMLVTTGTAAEDVVVAEATLFNGSTELDSQSVPSTGIVTFEGIALEIAADEAVELTVKLTFEDTNNGVAYANGETVTVAFTSIEDASDDNGNDESDMTITGTPASEIHVLRETGVNVTLDNETTSVVENNDTITTDDEGKFVLEFTVAAFGDDLYLPLGSSRTATTGDGVTWEILNDSNVAVATGTTSPLFASDDTTSSVVKTNSYLVQDGESEAFTLTVEFDPVTSGGYHLRLKSVNYATTDSATSAVSQDVRDQSIETGAELI